MILYAIAATALLLPLFLRLRGKGDVLKQLSRTRTEAARHESAAGFVSSC